MDAVEVDAEDLLGDRAVAEVDARLGDQAGERPEQLQGDDDHHAPTGRRSIPAAGRLSPPSGRDTTPGWPRPSTASRNGSGPVEVDRVGGALDLDHFGSGNDLAQLPHHFREDRLREVPCRSVTGQRIEASAARLGKGRIRCEASRMTAGALDSIDSRHSTGKRSNWGRRRGRRGRSRRAPAPRAARRASPSARIRSGAGSEQRQGRVQREVDPGFLEHERRDQSGVRRRARGDDAAAAPAEDRGGHRVVSSRSSAAASATWSRMLRASGPGERPKPRRS